MLPREEEMEEQEEEDYFDIIPPDIAELMERVDRMKLEVLEDED
jgi:hypothetical protein